MTELERLLMQTLTAQNKQVDALAQQVDTLAQQVEHLTKRLNELDVRMIDWSKQVASFDVRLNTLIDSLERLNE